MPRDAVSRTANVGTVGKNWLRKRNGGQKWVKAKIFLFVHLKLEANVTCPSIEVFANLLLKLKKNKSKCTHLDLRKIICRVYFFLSFQQT